MVSLSSVVLPTAHHPLLCQVQELAQAEEEAGQAHLDPGEGTGDGNGGASASSRVMYVRPFSGEGVGYLRVGGIGTAATLLPLTGCRAVTEYSCAHLAP